MLSSLQGWNIEFALGDAAYDSEKIRKTAEQVGIFFVSPINRRKNEERKDAYGRVIPILKTDLESGYSVFEAPSNRCLIN